MPSKEMPRGGIEFWWDAQEFPVNVQSQEYRIYCWSEYSKGVQSSDETYEWDTVVRKFQACIEGFFLVLHIHCNETMLREGLNANSSTLAHIKSYQDLRLYT